MGVVNSIVSNYTPQPIKKHETFDHFLSFARNKDDFFRYFTLTRAKSLLTSNPQLFQDSLEKCISVLQKSLQKDSDSLDNCLPSLRILTRLLGVTVSNPSSRLDPTKEKNTVEKDPIFTERKLIQCLTDLLFYPGVSIPDIYVFSKDEAKLLWAKRGNFQNGWKGVESNYIYDANRHELLNCIIICLSSVLYPNQNQEWNIFFTLEENKRVRTLFYSIVNTLCSYRHGREQYFNTNFTRLFSSCADIFLLSTTKEFESLKSNIFVECFSESSFEIFHGDLLDSILAIWEEIGETQMRNVERTLLLESLLIFWRLVSKTKNFVESTLIPNIKSTLPELLNILISANADRVEMAGVVHLCLLTILHLSNFRQFCISLNTPFRPKSSHIKRLNNLENCSIGEILIVFLNQVVNGIKPIELDHKAIYQSVLGILVNISPYIKSIGINSSVSLMSIFERFYKIYKENCINKDAIITVETKHYLNQILETFSSLIQYHYKGCSHLIYAILYKKDKFIELKEFSREKFSTEHTEKELKNGAISVDNVKMELKKLIVDTLVRKMDIIGVNEKSKMTNNKMDNGLLSDDKLEEETILSSKEKHHNTMELKYGQNKREWQENKMLLTIISLIDFLDPMVRSLKKTKGKLDQNSVLRFLGEQEMVGILPSPHKIKVAKLYQSKEIVNWLQRLIWKSIINRDSEYEFLDLKAITMFKFVNINDEE